MAWKVLIMIALKRCLIKLGQRMGSYLIHQEYALSETAKNHWDEVAHCMGNLILAQVANAILLRLLRLCYR